jgi:Uma2 family endonuclease
MTWNLALPDVIEAPPESDPFCYGTRIIRRRQPDGSFELLRVPLTLWDVLHPQEGDHLVHSIRHSKEVRYLASVLEARVAGDKHALVLSDTAIHWDVPGLSHHSPDVAVIRDIREVADNYSSFSVADEGVRPSLIIEVVSPQTLKVRETDTITKVREYHAALVPLYVIVDREREEDWPILRGYRWKPLGYEPIALDDRDCLLLEGFGLRLCANQKRIALYDAVTGEELGDYTAISQALEAEIAAREAAEKQARLAQEQARLAQEQARRAQEHARAEEEARRQAEEARRREEEARQRAESGQRLAEEKARSSDEALRMAEEKMRNEATARADLERQLRELQARLLNPPDAGSRS